MKSTSNGCLSRAGRSKTASGIVVYLMEELGDARLRAAQLKQYVSAALELVDKSEKRDHLFEVGAHLIHGIPDTLFKLEKALDAAAMAAARMDYEEIKQGLKPEKAEELERVLDDVRLHYLKRRSTVMNAKEAAIVLDKFAEVTKSSGRVPTADLARLIARLEQGLPGSTSVVASHSSAVDPSKGFREAAEYLRTSQNPSRRDLAASLRLMLANALVAEESLEAGAGEEFKKVNPDISDEAVEKIDEMHEEHKDVVKDKSASDEEEEYDFSGLGSGSAALTLFETAFSDAKRAHGAAANGNDRAAATHGLNCVVNMLTAVGETSPKYKDKISDLAFKVVTLMSVVRQDAAKSDVLQRQASDKESAYGDPYWLTAKYPGKDKNGKPFKKGEKVFYYPKTKTILTGPEAEKAAKDFDSASFDEDVYNYRAASEHEAEGLDDACWEGYEAVGLKPGEGGKMVPNCVPVKKASSEPVADDWKAARFEEGKPADPTENMSEEDAAKWKVEHEKNKDRFKSAKLQARQEAILKKYLASGGDAMMFDDLPSNVQNDLRKVKDQETLWSDVDRWLGDHNNPHLRSKWAVSTDPWKA